MRKPVDKMITLAKDGTLHARRQVRRSDEYLCCVMAAEWGNACCGACDVHSIAFDGYFIIIPQIIG